MIFSRAAGHRCRGAAAVAIHGVHAAGGKRAAGGLTLNVSSRSRGSVSAFRALCVTDWHNGATAPQRHTACAGLLLAALMPAAPRSDQAAKQARRAHGSTRAILGCADSLYRARWRARYRRACLSALCRAIIAAWHRSCGGCAGVAGLAPCNGAAAAVPLPCLYATAALHCLVTTSSMARSGTTFTGATPLLPCCGCWY